MAERHSKDLNALQNHDYKMEHEHQKAVDKLVTSMHDMNAAHIADLKHDFHTLAQMQGRIDQLVHDQTHPQYNYDHHTGMCADIEHMLTAHPGRCVDIRQMYNDAHCCGLQPPPAAPPEVVAIEVGVIVMTTIIALAAVFFTIYYSIRYCACCACCKCCACCYCRRRRKKVIPPSRGGDLGELRRKLLLNKF